MNHPKPNNPKKRFNQFIRYSGLGFEMMAIIGGFTFLGYKIDRWMNNDFKGFTLVLMTFSVITATVYGTKNALKMSERKPNKTNNLNK